MWVMNKVEVNEVCIEEVLVFNKILSLKIDNNLQNFIIFYFVFRYIIGLFYFSFKKICEVEINGDFIFQLKKFRFYEVK